MAGSDPEMRLFPFFLTQQARLLQEPTKPLQVPFVSRHGINDDLCGWSVCAKILLPVFDTGHQTLANRSWLGMLPPNSEDVVLQIFSRFSQRNIHQHQGFVTGAIQASELAATTTNASKTASGLQVLDGGKQGFRNA